MKNKILKKYLSFYHHSIRCVEFSPDDGLLYWRERLFNGLLFFMILGGTFAIIPNLLASIITQEYIIAIIDLFSYLTIIILFVFKRIKLSVKVSILTIFIYLLSLLLLIKLGSFGPGLLWLVACSIVVALMHGFSATIRSIGFNIVIILCLAFLIKYSKLESSFFKEYDFVSWLAISLNVILINAITAIPLALLLNTLDQTLLSEKKLKEKQVIYSKKLEIEKKKAQESDRLKSAFLANLSHDIRTPMNAIMGFSELIEMESSDNPLLKKYASQIFKNSDYLKNLINDIVDISLIESKQIKFTYNYSDLNSIIAELKAMIELMPQMINRPDLQISFLMDKKLNNKMIYLDKTHLKQVLINLITNSIKYTPQGNIEVSIKKKIRNIQFTVKDSGVGIPLSQQNKVFKRFLKIERKGEMNIPGIGLGLSISKALTKAMHGEIWFKSDEGKGTTFYVTLPLKKEHST